MRYSYILVSLLLHGLLSGQDLNFIQADARWQVETDIQNTAYTSPDYIFEYTFGRDTLLNDTLYTLVQYHYFAREEGFGGYGQFPQPFQPSLPIIYGAVREDLVEKKVYLRVFNTQNDNYFEPEKLLYDFSIESSSEFIDIIIGDPVQIDYIGTQFIHGAERKIWSTGEVQIIEGIGSTNGPFEGLITLISGSNSWLLQYCQGAAMDCNVAVDGFVNNQRQWNVKTRVSSLDGNSVTYTREYRFLDTTLVDGHVYFELYERGMPYEGEFSTTGILFRQDDSSRVYRIDPAWETSETLIYDFDLAGSPFVFDNNYHPGLSYELIAIDSFPLADGSNRQIFYFMNPSPFPIVEFMPWYEGIGDVFNPFLPEWVGCPIVDGPNYLLLCYYDDFAEDVTYRNDEGFDCYENLVSTTALIQPSPPLLYPNPSDGRFYLDQVIPAARLQLYDLSGRLMADFPIQQQQVNLTGLASGTYPYRLFNAKQQQVSQGKVVIE